MTPWRQIKNTDDKTSTHTEKHHKSLKKSQQKLKMKEKGLQNSSLNAQHVEPWTRWDETTSGSCDIQMVGSEFESMDPSCLVSTVQAGGGGVMVGGVSSWPTLSPLVPAELRLNTTAHLRTVAHRVHPLMIFFFFGLLQQTASCQLEHDDEFAALQRPPQSPDLSPTPLGCGGTGDSDHWCRRVNMDQNVWGMFLVVSVPQRIQAVLKVKWS